MIDCMDLVKPLQILKNKNDDVLFLVTSKEVKGTTAFPWPDYDKETLPKSRKLRFFQSGQKRLISALVPAGMLL